MFSVMELLMYIFAIELVVFLGFLSVSIFLDIKVAIENRKTKKEGEKN